MHKPVIWSPLSENDFENILEYLDKKWDNKVASNFIELTENLLNQVVINPRQFPIFYKRKKVRKCVLTKHNSLFYRDGKTHIEILRIYDTRQDPNTLTFNSPNTEHGQ
jgi:plasmid stabilization system protein ParE